MVKELGLPRDSLERRRGGRGGPAPRRDRREDGNRVAKRLNNDYNSQFKRDAANNQNKKRTGFNPMAKAHMGSDAYKGHAKKLKADLIHKAKVKKEYARVLKQEAEETPEFYKKVRHYFKIWSIECFLKFQEHVKWLQTLRQMLTLDMLFN